MAISVLNFLGKGNNSLQSIVAVVKEQRSLVATSRTNCARIGAASMSKNVRYIPLVLPSAFFLCFCSLSSLSLPVRSPSSGSETQSVSSKPGWSVTLKITMPNGSWIRAAEVDGGHVTIQRNQTVLTLFPHVLNENRLSLTARLVGNSAEGPMVRETSFEIETNAFYRLPREWSRFGLALDLKVEGIQRMSLKPHSEHVSFAKYSDGDLCCVTCNEVKACGCAVQAPCGSCCAGECCN